MKPAIRSLLERAARLRTDITEITGPDDVRYRIRRASDTQSLRLDTTEASRPGGAGQPGGDRSIVWTRSRERPDFYPDDLPFLPGVDAVLVLTSNGRSCTWSAEARERHIEGCSGGSLEAMLALRPSEETTAALHEIWSSAVEQSSTLGWTVVDEAASDFPFPIRTTVLERLGKRRKIDRGGVMGLPVVTLNEMDPR